MARLDLYPIGQTRSERITPFCRIEFDRELAVANINFAKLQAYATGAYPKYLLSGLLYCGICGSNLVASGPRQGYVCSSRVNGASHACANRLRLPRVRLEN